MERDQVLTATSLAASLLLLGDIAVDASRYEAALAAYAETTAIGRRFKDSPTHRDLARRYIFLGEQRTAATYDCTKDRPAMRGARIRASLAVSGYLKSLSASGDEEAGENYLKEVMAQAWDHFSKTFLPPIAAATVIVIAVAVAALKRRRTRGRH